MPYTCNTLLYFAIHKVCYMNRLFQVPKKKSLTCSKAWIITSVFKDESSGAGNVMCPAQARTARKRHGQEGEARISDHKVRLCCFRAHAPPKGKRNHCSSHEDTKGIFLDLLSYLRLEFYFSLIILHKHVIFKNMIWTLLVIYQRQWNYPEEELLTQDVWRISSVSSVSSKRVWACGSLARDFPTAPTNCDRLSVTPIRCLTFLWSFLTIK